MKTIITPILTLLFQSITLSQSLAFDGKPIAVIINSELYPQVKDSIDLYLNDLEKEGHKVLFSQWNNNAHPDVEELKTLLKEYHQNLNLEGAVLIGKLPYANGKKGEAKGPLETYLMDLNNDAKFIKDSDGYITGHQGPINLDIWVSRIFAPQREMRVLLSGMSEADLIKNYFEKNHLYRTCQSPVSDLKIKFYACEEYMDIIDKLTEYTNSWTNFYQYLEKSGYPQEYLEFVKNNPAQYLYLKSHSTPELHQFEFADRLDLYSSRDMSENAHIKQPFILLDACSACRFSDSESLGNAYLFGPHSSALVVAGLTIPGNLIYIQFLHSNGNSFGNNFNSHSETTFSTFTDFAPLCIFFAAVAIVKQDPSIVAKALLGFVGGLVLKYGIKEMFINDAVYESFGFTLLGDPTLKPYINMDWCPQYDAKKDL